MAHDAETQTTPAVHFAPRPRITVFGVGYLHLRIEDGSDLYVTQHGLPFIKCLLPESHWADKAWFAAHSVKLPGTSAVHRITTKEVDGKSIDIVLKWNRMGQDIPGETEATDLNGAAFNSPFEEFSSVIELRNVRRESPGQLFTHRPLAIYVPRKYVAAERLGRKPYKMDSIQKTHDEIVLDWNRNYAVIYQWVKGIDAVEAMDRGFIDEADVATLMARVDQDMRRKGFLVRDGKPHHVIVRPSRDGGLTRDRAGEVLYAMVDFELLHRTPQHDQALRAVKRRAYLARQVRRFETREQFPPDLTPMTIMGVDYVYGRVESTGGALWTVGRDPILFDYFLPEKWRRTPRTRLSAARQVFHTVSKDNIYLVWRVSQVGLRPDMDPFVAGGRRVLGYGYNSPFEEVAISLEMSRAGIETTYPRAIYMTGHKSSPSSGLIDRSRYDTHADFSTPDGHPILSEHHDCIIIWGYWNGPDELLAVKDEQHYKGIDALAAYREGHLSQREYLRVMHAAKQRLATVGVEDLNLRGTHLLLSLDKSGHIARDADGLPMVRICNFELLKRK